MTNNIKWKERIVTMLAVKRHLWDVDKEELWPQHLPRVAATAEMIERCERLLGAPLDEEYRNFLKCADGWKGFYQTVDLFGTTELIDGPSKERADEMLGLIDAAGVLSSSGVPRDSLLPIAVTLEDKDLFVLVKLGAPHAGHVLWFAGEEIDRFPSFTEYFLAMIDYNREDAASLLEELKAEGLT